MTDQISSNVGGRRGRGRMIVGLASIFVQSVPITTKVSLNPNYDKVHSIQHYVIQFVSD